MRKTIEMLKIGAVILAVLTFVSCAYVLDHVRFVF